MAKTQPRLTAAFPPLVAEGRLDRDAVTSALRLCLNELLSKAHLELSYEIRNEHPAKDSAYEHPELSVVFSGRDNEMLLERNAELLQALEYLALRWIRIDPQFYGRVRFDSADYRALRIEELRLSAHVAAERVRETRAPFRLNPMSPRERRVVHLALKDEPGIRTTSEGEGEERQVVIYPADRQ